ncbi:MAG: hypothetical protein IJ149_07735 [Oscillospiraceae bacterium]|nr:hypothetical protein [Oscillospiraceae bacterium]
MVSIVFQVVCVLLIIAAAVLYAVRNSPSKTGARGWQVALCTFQVVMCGWFFALAISDLLDIRVNFSPVRLVLDVFYYFAFAALSVYALFNKNKVVKPYFLRVVWAALALVAVQCFIFPYENEYEALRIFEMAEGAVIYALLIVLALRPENIRFNSISLAVIVILEFAVAIESTVVPMASITEDFQTVDIPLNYASLFMRPAFFSSLALAYRVWCDRRKAAQNS